ncbi:MAG: acetamidase/formamidase family protein [Pseudomonas sp.]
MALPSHFTTESYPLQQRCEAWRSALEPYALVPQRSGDEALFGALTTTTSPQGVVLSVLSASPQQLQWQPGIRAGDIQLALHIEGEASLFDAAKPVRLKPGDIGYRIADAPGTIAMGSHFRQLLVSIPRSSFRARMPAPLSPRVGVLSGRSGIVHVFSSLLGALADTIDDLGTEQIRPIDIALSELLITSLANDRLMQDITGSTSTQTAVLHRISQLIEARLDAPDLGIAQIAQEAGVSTRYLQKLFESADDNFSHYVRVRRLERCRADLINPVYAHLSISDICYRWSFNDSAHFSRAFKEQYGVSPRKYRRDINQALPGDLLAHISRGWPALSQQTTRNLRGNDGGDVPRSAATAGNGAAPDPATTPHHHHLPVSAETVHWGYFSASLPPVLEVDSGDVVTIETLTHHAYDDHERMIAGDAGAESVFGWTATRKNVDRRGSGPMDASVYGRGAGEGFGVHICTGPVAVRGAEPGDVLEIRILDVRPRLSANPHHHGHSYGSNAAAWWGFHYNELLTEPKQREVVTIYELTWHEHGDYARALYNFRWTPQTDPFGMVHPKIDYPGVPVDHATLVKNPDVLKNVRIPVQPHFGVLALAPRYPGLVDSVPPSHFGGNIDNRRAGKGATMYLPVSVPGALFSVGDPHASQGDSELCGTAIESSMTGVFQLILHKKDALAGKPFEDLNYPLLETADEWVLHGFSHANYLAELGEKAQVEIYKKSSLDLAMQDAFRKMRRLLMTYKQLSEDEALSLISVAVDFGITQVVDGNWCVHGILRKDLFVDGED